MISATKSQTWKSRTENQLNTCVFCGNVIKCRYVARSHCNSDCNRAAIFFKNNGLDSSKQMDNKCVIDHDLFVAYAKEMIEKEPILYYKEWEYYLRYNAMPGSISDLITQNIPLPRPNIDGIGLPTVNYSKKVLIEKWVQKHG